jgi:ribonuclease Z
VSRIEDILARCEDGLATSQRTEVDGNNHFSKLMTNDVDFDKTARSIECSFNHNASLFDGLPQDINQIDENEIDLNDDSCSDEGDIRVQLKNDHALETGTAKALHNAPSILMLGTGCATPSPLRGGSAYALLMPTSLNGNAELIPSALIECGEGTLTALCRHLPPLNSLHCDSTTKGAATRLNNHLSHVCFIWISHAHLDHYGDLPIVIQAITNAKIKLGCRHRQANQLLVIAPSKVIKYLNVLLGQNNLLGSNNIDGSNRHMYIGVTHRELSYSPFARHLLSLITNYALPAPPTLQDLTQRQSQNCSNYKPFVSLQNVDVEHCMDSFGLILEMNIPSYTNESNIGRCQHNNPSNFLLCFSGDTRPSNNLIQKCRSYFPSRVDLLIHEGTFLDDPRGRLEAVRKRHSTTAEALNVASGMNTKACIITHFSQRYKHISYDDISSGQDVPWLGVAFDGMIVPLTEQALMSLSGLTKCIDFLIRE